LRFVIFTVLLFLSCNGQSKKTAESFTDITACLFSQISYCTNPQAKLDKYLPRWKVVWNTEALNGNHAFVASDGKRYVVAIRGSLMEFSWDAFENWIYQDMNIISQEDWKFAGNKDARISTGSYRGWENLVKMKDKQSGKDILSFLQTYTDKKTPVIFTGHSLGGNLATVLASWYSFKMNEAGHPRDSLNVITFAAPAAGNKTFAEDFNKRFPRSLRIENTGDIVPKFPCKEAVSNLGGLYSPGLSASDIYVGYKNATVSLGEVFKGLYLAIAAAEVANGFSSFTQTNGKGTLITAKLSGDNNHNDILSWFAEAGHQHGIAQYAVALGAPVVDCNAP
jgi:hypothetical protein